MSDGPSAGAGRCVDKPNAMQAVVSRVSVLVVRAEGVEAFARSRMEDWFGCEPSPPAQELPGPPDGQVHAIVAGLDRIEQALLATENWLHKAD